METAAHTSLTLCHAEKNSFKLFLTPSSKTAFQHSIIITLSTMTVSPNKSFLFFPFSFRRKTTNCYCWEDLWVLSIYITLSCFPSYSLKTVSSSFVVTTEAKMLQACFTISILLPQMHTHTCACAHAYTALAHQIKSKSFICTFVFLQPWKHDSWETLGDHFVFTSL